MKNICTLVFLISLSLSSFAQKEYADYSKFEFTFNLTDLLVNASNIEELRQHGRIARNIFTIKKYQKKNKYKYLALSITPDNILRRRRFFFGNFPGNATPNVDIIGQGFLFGFAVGEEFKHPMWDSKKWERSFRYEFKYIWGEKNGESTTSQYTDRSTNALGFGMMWEVEYKIKENFGISTGIGWHYFVGGQVTKTEQISGFTIEQQDFYDRFELSYPNAIQLNFRFGG